MYHNIKKLSGTYRTRIVFSKLLRYIDKLDYLT